MKIDVSRSEPGRRLVHSACVVLGVWATVLASDDALAQNDWTLWEPQPYARRPADPVQPPPAPPTHESPAASFGGPGEIVITNGAGAGLDWMQWSASQASVFAASLAPGFDAFVARNVSVGIEASVSYRDAKGYGADGSLVDSTIAALSGAPRFRVNVPLGEHASLYPSLTIGFEWVQHDQQPVPGSTSSVAGSPLGYASTTQMGPWAGVYVPLLWHARPHFFLGFGPRFFHDFGSAQGGPEVGGQRTTIGASMLVGTWWGGENDAAARPAPGREARERRFGETGEVVLTGAVDASANWTTYAGSGSSQTTMTLAPGIDYFVADGLSLGGSVGASVGSWTGIDPTTRLPVDTESAAGAIQARIGLDLPPASEVSWYPWVGLGVGAASLDERSGAAQNKYSDTYVFLSVYAPVLVQVASHAFLGFGPSLLRDLHRSTVAYGAELAQQNLGTRIGATFVVGGWL